MSAVSLPLPRPLRRRPLLRFALRRVAIGLVLAWLVTVLVFTATMILPGDPATAVLGRSATPAVKAELRRELGLDRPLLVQYGHWLGDLAHGNLGRSIASQRPVTEYLGERITNTLALSLATLAVVIPLALLLGVWSGVRADRVADHAIAGASLAAIAVPEFVTGTLLALLVAVKLGWVPPVSLVPPGSDPLSHPSLLVLPVATLTLAGLAYLVRMVRAGVVEAMQSEYVEMARLNGLPERRVVWRHGLRNALATTVQVVAATVQWLVGGVAITETVFQYPGLGAALVQAVTQRDFPVVQAATLLIALLYIAINVVADVVVVLLVPKLRTAQ